MNFTTTYFMNPTVFGLLTLLGIVGVGAAIFIISAIKASNKASSDPRSEEQKLIDKFIEEDRAEQPEEASSNEDEASTAQPTFTSERFDQMLKAGRKSHLFIGATMLGVFASIFIVVIGGTSLLTVIEQGAKTELNQQVIAQAEEIYGLGLTEAQTEKLTAGKSSWSLANADQAGAITRYGTAEWRDADGNYQTAQLAWDQTEFVLVEPADKGELQELPAR